MERPKAKDPIGAAPITRVTATDTKQKPTPKSRGEVDPEDGNKRIGQWLDHGWDGKSARSYILACEDKCVQHKEEGGV